MAILESDVVVGGHYLTENNQERLVTEINGDLVLYNSRSGDSSKYGAARQWSPCPTKSNPPSIKKFAEDCSEVLFKPAEEEVK